MSITKSVTLLGPNALISPNTGTRVTPALITGSRWTIGADNISVTIQGFDFTGTASGGGTGAIEVTGGTRTGVQLQVIRNNFYNIGRAGVHTSLPVTNRDTNSGWVVRDNRVNVTNPGTGSNRSGFNLGNINNLLIEDNVIFSPANNGVGLSNNQGVTLRNNTFDSTTAAAVNVSGTIGSAEILNNTFRNITGNSAIALNNLAIITNTLLISGNVVTNTLTALSITGDVPTDTIRVHWNSFSSGTNGALRGLGSGRIDAVCNWWGDTSGPTLADNPDGTGLAVISNTAALEFAPWLNSGTDALTETPGFQPITSTLLTPIGDTNAARNDYRLLANAFGCVQSGTVITLDGSFDLSAPNAATAFLRGSDSRIGTADDGSVIVRGDAADVQVLGPVSGATITGPGSGTFLRLAAGNTGWTITRLRVNTFATALDLSDDAALAITFSDLSDNPSFGVASSSTGTVTATCNWWGDARGPLAPDNLRGTGSPVSSGVVYSPWNNRDDLLCQADQRYGTPAQMLWLTQPGNGITYQALTQQPALVIQDADGNPAINANMMVTLELMATPGNGVLRNNAVAAVDGVITFTNLAVDNAGGAGYTLRATGGGFTSTTSAAFDIANPAPVPTGSDPARTILRDLTTIDITGDNFVDGAFATWSGAPRTTSFISRTLLRVTLAPGDLATVGAIPLRVVNPTALVADGGTSDSFDFIIDPTMVLEPGIALFPVNATRTLTITLSDALPDDTVISLSSSDFTRLSVPPTVTVPAGTPSVPFALTTLAGTTTPVTISAQLPAVRGSGITTATVQIDGDIPEVSISAPALLLTNGPPVTFTISYTGADSITLVPADITLLATGTASATVSVSGSGNTRLVTLSALSGDGTLAIALDAGTASDTAGNQAPASGPSTPATVDTSAPQVSVIYPAHTSALTASLWLGSISGSASDGTGSGVQSVAVRVRQTSSGNYWDGVAFASTVQIFRAANGTNAWSLALPRAALVPGSYQIVVQVVDIAGNQTTGAPVQFTVLDDNLGPPPDTEVPIAELGAPLADRFTLGSAPYLITVVYTDNIALDVSSIASSNLSVNGPRGALSLSLVGPPVITDNRIARVVYAVNPPDGVWAMADLGEYRVSLSSNAVRDLGSNSVAPRALGVFQLRGNLSFLPLVVR